jgi:ribosomal protein S18 acetylase RimI-like enzyme
VNTVIEDRSSAVPGPGLLELVDQISAAPPYSYRPGELPPASDWFTRLAARRAARLWVARDRVGHPAGYALALPLSEHAARDAVSVAVAAPGRALYLAELGVAGPYRRQGIASRLLACATAHVPGCEVVVRTLAGNAPVIAFYQRRGFRIVDGIRHAHRGRERLFLLRQPDAVPDIRM